MTNWPDALCLSLVSDFRLVQSALCSLLQLSSKIDQAAGSQSSCAQLDSTVHRSWSQPLVICHTLSATSGWRLMADWQVGCFLVILLTRGRHTPSSPFKSPTGHRCIKASTLLFLQPFVKEWSLSGAQWIPAWYCDRMLPVQQVRSWNFLTPKYSTVNCQWYYNKVEVIGNNSNSAMKW